MVVFKLSQFLMETFRRNERKNHQTINQALDPARMLVHVITVVLFCNLTLQDYSYPYRTLRFTSLPVITLFYSPFARHLQQSQ